MKIKYLTILLISTFFVACNEDNGTDQEPTTETKEQVEEIVEVIDPRIDAIDQIVTELDQKEQWDAKKKFEMLESTEGGELKFFYTGDQISHILEIHYGEMGKKENKYYFQNGNLIYTQETTLQYNAPFYMEDEFDITLIDTIISNTYFENEIILLFEQSGGIELLESNPESISEQRLKILSRISELKEYLK